jgi:hypothetical protein
MDNRNERKRLTIAKIKQKTSNFIKVFTSPSKSDLENPMFGQYWNYSSISEDIINTDYYFSGVVTAYYTFPILNSDPGFSNWESVLYSHPGRFVNGSGDIIFIEDETGAIAINGTQFYANSYRDNENPPNVDSGYVPHKYHIEVGDTLEIYSGRIVNNQRFYYANNVQLSAYSKTTLSFENSVTCYTVIPNKRIINASQQIVDDIYTRPIRFETKLPKSKMTSIPGIGVLEEGTLVTINNVKFDPTKKTNTSQQNPNNKNLIFLQPGLCYTVIDDFGNSIDFRVCHGTEMAKYFTEMTFDKKFNLTGIVAGTDINGWYEIWPRNVYDLGKPLPKNSSVTSQDMIDLIYSS